ncbi:hypothetical protein L1987_08811 [Smallanthus sonchifolius]|uniref:Uncharacterized protein n=1 Tax=Smallanthus sonchifolius TaxID=185202 RepID=A0ACB9JMS6_9ASTR|nr:hypothetical protein L1987_08811 [Smallanthus sonchifolius]
MHPPSDLIIPSQDAPSTSQPGDLSSLQENGSVDAVIDQATVDSPTNASTDQMPIIDPHIPDTEEFSNPRFIDPKNYSAPLKDGIPPKELLDDLCRYIMFICTILPWSEPPCRNYFLEVLKDGSIIDQFDVHEKGAYMFGRVDLCVLVMSFDLASYNLPLIKEHDLSMEAFEK